MAEPKFFRLIDYSGGLNSDQHEMLLADNEATDILNVRLDKTGSLITRDGTTLIPGLDGTKGSILQLGAWRNPKNLDQSKIVAKVGSGEIVKYDPNTLGLVTLATGFSTTRRGNFSNSETYVAYADGTRTPVVYDGTTALPMGLPSPSAPSVAAGGSGGWSGNWSFIITQVLGTTGAESGASAPVSISLTSNQPMITRSTLATDASAWNVYAWDEADPNGVFYLVNPTPIPAIDTDYSVPSGAPDLYFNFTPSRTSTLAPNLEKLAFFNGVYFGTIDNKLYWSMPLVPWVWPGENTTTLPFEGNDRVMGMAALQDSLIIFGRRNILVVSGFYPAFSVTRVDAAIGLVGEDAVSEIEGQAVFLSDEGLRVFPGMGVVGEGIRRTLAGKPLAVKEAAILRHSPRENALWLTIDGATYVVFLGAATVSRYDFNPTAILSGGLTGVSANVLTNHAGDKAYINSGTQDITSDIPIIWRSKVFSMENPETTKFIRRIGLFATRGSEANITLALLDTSGAVATVTPSAQGVSTIKWDQFTWEDDGDPNTNYTWSTEGVTYFLSALPAQTLLGMTLQLFISGDTKAGTEFVPPLTILYRESLRFLGR